MDEPERPRRLTRMQGTVEEEEMDRELEVLGLLDDGMTKDEKEQLMRMLNESKMASGVQLQEDSMLVPESPLSCCSDGADVTLREEKMQSTADRFEEEAADKYPDVIAFLERIKNSKIATKKLAKVDPWIYPDQRVEDPPPLECKRIWLTTQTASKPMLSCHHQPLDLAAIRRNLEDLHQRLIRGYDLQANLCGFLQPEWGPPVASGKHMPDTIDAYYTLPQRCNRVSDTKEDSPASSPEPLKRESRAFGELFNAKTGNVVKQLDDEEHDDFITDIPSHVATTKQISLTESSPDQIGDDYLEGPVQVALTRQTSKTKIPLKGIKNESNIQAHTPIRVAPTRQTFRVGALSKQIDDAKDSSVQLSSMKQTSKINAPLTQTGDHIVITGSRALVAPTKKTSQTNSSVRDIVERSPAVSGKQAVVVQSAPKGTKKRLCGDVPRQAKDSVTSGRWLNVTAKKQQLELEDDLPDLDDMFEHGCEPSNFRSSSANSRREVAPKKANGRSLINDDGGAPIFRPSVSKKTYDQVVTTASGVPPRKLKMPLPVTAAGGSSKRRCIQPSDEKKLPDRIRLRASRPVARKSSTEDEEDPIGKPLPVATARRGDDVRIDTDSIGSSNFPCPICDQVFPADVIESHAAECFGPEIKSSIQDVEESVLLLNTSRTPRNMKRCYVCRNVYQEGDYATHVHACIARSEKERSDANKTVPVTNSTPRRNEVGKPNVAIYRRSLLGCLTEKEVEGSTGNTVLNTVREGCLKRKRGCDQVLHERRANSTGADVLQDGNLSLNHVAISPFTNFVPISRQTDTLIDYKNQFSYSNKGARVKVKAARRKKKRARRGKRKV